MAATTVLYRNSPQTTSSTGGRPARASNAPLMRNRGGPDQYSAGLIHKVAEHAVGCLYAAYLEKIAGEEREPVVDDHDSAPRDNMRPRAELILFSDKGVYAVDKGDYLLFPGGGVDDGEQARDAAIRETLEEANRHPVNVDAAGMVESVWPTDSGNEFWDDSEFSGERTYFFVGKDSGEAGITHADLEDFKVMPFSKAIQRLNELIDDEEQSWAKRNNEERLALVEEAERRAQEKPRKQAQAAPQQPATEPVSPVEAAGIQKSRTTKFVEALKARQQGQAGPAVAPQPQPAPAVKAAEDVIEGGLADGEPDERYDERELRAGTKVEMEHTDDRVEAKEIAKDHLEEISDYYTRLAALEAEAEELKDEGHRKVADTARFLPRSEYLMFTPDNKLVVRRQANRRMGFPTEGQGKPAPYESRVQYIPETGVPEEGYHGYDIGLNIGEAREVPEGYDVVPASDVLKELYASMGLAANKPFRNVDRLRARSILRYLKKKEKERRQVRDFLAAQEAAATPQELPPQPQPVAPPVAVPPEAPETPAVPGGFGVTPG